MSVQLISRSLHHPYQASGPRAMARVGRLPSRTTSSMSKKRIESVGAGIGAMSGKLKLLMGMFNRAHLARTFL